MDAYLFFRGFLIGFAIAAPVGPIGILCIRRSLNYGMRTGFATGLGAATADALYGAVAAFGLASISQFLVGQQFWLGIVGGLFLCYIGITTWRTKAATPDSPQKTEIKGAYLSSLLLTLTNPATILSFIGIFAGIGLASGTSYYEAGYVTLGVFTGSALWWFFLSLVFGLLLKRLTQNWLQRINYLSGIFMFLFGIWCIAQVFNK